MTSTIRPGGRWPLRHAPDRAPWFLWLGAISAAGASVIPLWYLADRILDGGTTAIGNVFGGGRLGRLLWSSTALAAVVGVAAGAVGTTTAWVLGRVRIPGARFWHVAVTVPLAVPSYVAAYAWVSWIPSISGFWGAAFVLTCVSAPLVHLSVSAGLAQLDRAQEEVARSLGWSTARILRSLTLPQLRRHLSSGILLVVLYVLSDFGVVAVMRYEAFTWAIYGAYRAGFDPNRAAVLAGALVVVALAVIVAETLARGRTTAPRVGAGTTHRSAPTESAPAVALGMAALASVAAVSLGLPVSRALLWVSRDPGAVDGAEFFDALRSTARLTLLATVATLAVALPVALLVARHPSPASHALERSVYVAHSLPGIVMAISFVFVGVRLLQPIYLTTPLLLMAYVSLMTSLAVGTIRASAERIPAGLVESARALGWGRGQVLRRVLVPLTGSGIGAGAAMVALTVAKELPTTLLLRPTGVETLATRTWRYAGVSDDTGVGPYALALIAISVLPAAYLALHRPRTRP